MTGGYASRNGWTPRARITRQRSGVTATMSAVGGSPSRIETSPKKSPRWRVLRDGAVDADLRRALEDHVEAGRRSGPGAGRARPPGRRPPRTARPRPAAAASRGRANRANPARVSASSSRVATSPPPAPRGGGTGPCRRAAWSHTHPARCAAPRAAPWLRDVDARRPRGARWRPAGARRHRMPIAAPDRAAAHRRLPAVPGPRRATASRPWPRRPSRSTSPAERTIARQGEIGTGLFIVGDGPRARRARRPGHRPPRARRVLRRALRARRRRPATRRWSPRSRRPASRSRPGTRAGAARAAGRRPRGPPRSSSPASARPPTDHRT